MSVHINHYIVYGINLDASIKSDEFFELYDKYIDYSSDDTITKHHDLTLIADCMGEPEYVCFGYVLAKTDEEGSFDNIIKVYIDEDHKKRIQKELALVLDRPITDNDCSYYVISHHH